LLITEDNDLWYVMKPGLFKRMTQEERHRLTSVSTGIQIKRWCLLQK